jgi:Lrp/AsnC family transcriptional regulator for asnA, asnC and gidA
MKEKVADLGQITLFFPQFRIRAPKEVATPPAANEKLDDIDLAILAILQGDGRASFSAMARELNLPESTVRIRTRKILDSGLVSIVATGDPLKLGIPLDSLLLVHVNPPHASDVADALTAMPEVRYVGVTLGGATIVVESLHQDAHNLHRFLSSKLPGISGVKEVTSFQIVDIRKSVWDWQSWLHAACNDETPVGH